MPGWELYGYAERDALASLDILFAHGFEKQRKGRYEVREFEDLFATRMGVAHAQAVSSGSAALKVALQAAGVKSGDEVITSCFTFIATVEAILEVGARPVLVDVDETLNMNDRAAWEASDGGDKVIVAVHMLGECADVYGMIGSESVLIEDCCQAIGASHGGQLVGTFGALGCYSFDGGKTLCCGEGGMVVTNNPRQYELARAYSDHGHAYREVLPRGRDEGIVRGFNHRMTELQAAVGIAQLRKLDFMIMKQRKNKAALLKALDVKWLPNEPKQFVLNRWPVRQGADPAGDAATSLVFFCDDAKQAGKFVEGMAKYGLSTMNLPDALDWHFAERWRHLHSEIVHPDSVGWPASRALLERAVALPIMINWDGGDIAMMASQLREVARDMQ